MDRIVHLEIEAFKTRIYATQFHGLSIGEWNRLLSRGSEISIQRALAATFDIREDEHPVIE
jgi:hypothetical protein